MGIKILTTQRDEKLYTRNISAAASVQAAIVTDGLWTDHDWTHSGTGYTMTNGIPGSDDANTNRRLTAPIACSDEEASDYMSKENVQRVASIIDSAKFEELFPL